MIGNVHPSSAVTPYQHTAGLVPWLAVAVVGGTSIRRFGSARSYKGGDDT